MCPGISRGFVIVIPRFLAGDLLQETLCQMATEQRNCRYFSGPPRQKRFLYDENKGYKCLYAVTVK